MSTIIITTSAIATATAAFMILERIRPGRELPNAPGWYVRALAITLLQVGITFATNRLWIQLFGSTSLFDLEAMHMPIAEGLIGWFVVLS